MKPIWIIENIVREPSFLELATAVRKAGFELLELNRDYFHSLVENYHSQCVIFNGSIEMAKLVGERLRVQGNSPVTYSTWEKYLCQNFYGKMSDFLFNDDYVMVPLKEFIKRKYFFYGILGKEACVFVRPDDGDKTFKGGIVDLQDVDKWYEPAYGEKLAIISSPKNIRGEWRFVCSREKEIIAVSCYRYQGLRTLAPSAPKNATKLCQNVLDVGYFPDSVFCVDVAEDNDGNFWLLELTSFSSAGLYACNKDAIVKRVSEIALDDYENSRKVGSCLNYQA